MPKCIGLGAGGHAKVVVEILQLAGEYTVVGLLDQNQKLHGTKVAGVPVLGGDDLLPELQSQNICHAFIGVGGLNETFVRTKLYTRTKSAGMSIVSARHPSSVVSLSAEVGEGVTLMAGAIVNADARIGVNVTVNTGAIVEHDCIVNDHTHVASGARLAGQVEVGAGTLIGAGACILPGVTIGRNSIVGAGAVVVRSVPDHAVVAGSPACVLRRIAS